jgi:hypothetical protein
MLNRPVGPTSTAAGRRRPHTVGEGRCYLPVSGVGSRVMNQLVTPRTSASAVTW